MITTTAWVPRGFAAPFPKKYDFDEQEFERIAELAKLQLEDANEDLEEAQNQEIEQGSSSSNNGTSTNTRSETALSKPKESAYYLTY